MAVYKRVLVAIDGSATSDRAAGEAIALAKEQQAQLRAVHVIEDVPRMYFAYADGANLAMLEASVRQAGQEALARASATACQADVALETVLLPHHRERVGDVIVAEARAWPADLIVIGMHGRHGLAHLLLGSVAEVVVRAAPVPLLLVREQ